MKHPISVSIKPAAAQLLMKSMKLSCTKEREITRRCEAQQLVAAPVEVASPVQAD
jgi:hypothetical protein